MSLEKEAFDTLKHMSNTLDKMFEVLSKPTSLIARISEIITTIITILGIVGIIEIIKNWIGGG